MEFSRVSNSGPLPEDEEILSLVDLGKKYETLVDILKMANHDQVSINVDDEQRIITVYEGGNLTGEDAQLIAHNAEVLPVYAQSPLIEDGDQITSRWSAGDFRSLMRTLSELAQDMETETFVSTFPGQEGDLFKRPVILDIPNSADSRQQAVLDDITLTPSKVEGVAKWKLTTWRDIPLILIGSRRVGPSNMIKALAGFGGDDYMLRIASRMDPNQYANVSGLREGRMIAVCEERLRAYGWKVYPHYMLTNPPREIDIYAKRVNNNVVIQLKSTLRPETPWEVLKRNGEILKGISHTAEVLPRFPEGAVGFVITDGYRGDYYTWQRSLIDGVMVGTINDVEEIAGDALKAIDTLKSRAGFTLSGESEPLPDRTIDLFDWTICLIDKVAP
jgi:hypothetical protein